MQDFDFGDANLIKFDQI